MTDIWVERQDGSVKKLDCPARPLAFTQEEGGDFIKVGPHVRKLVRPAAVFFADGTVHDFVLERLGHEPKRGFDVAVERLKKLLACDTASDLEGYLASG